MGLLVELEHFGNEAADTRHTAGNNVRVHIADWPEARTWPIDGIRALSKSKRASLQSVALRNW
jgi:hypothetical protein